MSWRAVRLGCFLKNRQDRFKPKDEAIQNLKRVDKIDFSGKIYLSNKNSKTDMILVKQGDLLISGINVEKGAIAVYDGEEDITATIHYSSYEFDKQKIDIDFLKLFLKSPEFLQAIKEQVPCGIKTEIKPKHLLPLEVIIPELAEQKEVVAGFSTFHARQNSISTELNHQLALVQKLRQAYLREAMQGKLIPQDTADEPALILLERIKAKKEKLIAEKKFRRNKPLPPIRIEEMPFEIPSNWIWCRLGELAEIVRGGSPRPAGDKRFYEGEIPFLKVADLTADNEIYLHTHTYTIKEAGLHKTRVVEADTLMLTNSGATLGIPKICTFQTTFNDGIAAFLNLDFVDQKFLYYYLKSKSQWYLETASRGQGQPNLNTDIISNTPLPLPPLAEQERIVTRLEKLMKFCDELEANIKQGLANADRLLQVALKEALEQPKLSKARSYVCKRNWYAL